MRFRQFAVALALFMIGVVCGGYLFSKSLPRNILPFTSCQERCYKPAKIAALAASVGILRASFFIPGVVLESDTCLAIRNPRPEAKIHYVLFPKHDISNITALTPADSPYVLGCFSLARELVARDHLQGYRLYTNGPAFQEIAYLHFHLVADESNRPAGPLASGSQAPSANLTHSD